MEKFDCVIIGGGASGSVCAINMAREGFNVAVVDDNSFPAKKLLVTGNGKCNILNSNLSCEYYNVNVDEYFKRFDFEKMQAFFKSIGPIIYEDSQHRCYPITNSARTVVNAIKNQFEKLNIKFYGEQIVQNFQKKGDFFEIKLNNNVISSKKLVLACGGNKLFSCLKNEQIKPFVPSLVALKTVESTKKLEGVRVQNVKVVLETEGNQYSQIGEVLFKDSGVSGICVFNLSSHLARKNNFNSKLFIDLLPNITIEKTNGLIKEQMCIFENACDVLTGIVQEKIAQEILKRVNVLNLKSKQLTLKQIENISKLIHNLDFTTCDCYDNNQVYSGGIVLSSLSENLQSKNTSGLYFAGEIVDVDGECGGYNLSWAWASGMIVASDILLSLKCK